MNLNSRHYGGFSVMLAVLFCAALSFGHGCRQKVSKQSSVSAKDLEIDTTHIPKDTVAAAAVQSSSTGIIMLGSKKFSGYIRSVYPDGHILSYTSVYDGLLHGTFRSYYESGALHEVHQYGQNLSTGRYCSYWPNGKMQMDCLYFQDKKAGYYNRWYETGKPYMFLNYVDDKEDGLQRGWSMAGKLFINYAAKDGHKYGLQESGACYRLDSGKIVY